MTRDQCHSLNDGIDLIDLIQALWHQRLLIALFTAGSTLAALGYSYSVTPTYSSQAEITPAPINSFGTLAGGLNSQCPIQGESVLSSVVRLASDTFDVLITNLNSQIVRRDFDAVNSAYRQVAFQASRGKTAAPVLLIATGTEPQLAKAFIDAYLAYVTVATVYR